MGIVNMMIVVPMLIETVSFGFIYDHFLHTPTNALMFSAAPPPRRLCRLRRV